MKILNYEIMNLLSNGKDMKLLWELYTCWHNKDEYKVKKNCILPPTRFTESFAHRARGRVGRHAVRTRCEWPASNSGVQRRLRLQKCMPSVSFPVCYMLHFCSRLPPLSEGGQSGRDSCRLDLLATFLSREKLKN